MSEKKEVLAIMSKVKAYIKGSDMNTAGTVAEVLSDKIRELCDKAIENAKNAKRKTVMDKDFS
jgi:histone H3/H4